MGTQEKAHKWKHFLKRGWIEFRTFAFQGNLIDLAVAVVLGVAFKTVVDSLVAHIINPLIGFVTNPIVVFIGRHAAKGGGDPNSTLAVAWFHVREFIGALINFVIVALAVFLLIVKIVGPMTRRAVTSLDPDAPPPTTKECPMCCSTIPIKARKCAFCTSDLPDTPPAV